MFVVETTLKIPTRLPTAATAHQKAAELQAC